MVNNQSIKVINKLKTLLDFRNNKSACIHIVRTRDVLFGGLLRGFFREQTIVSYVLFLSATFAYGLLHLLTKVFTFRSTPEHQKYEVGFSPLKVLFTQPIYSFNTISFRQLDVSELTKCTLTSSQFRDT